MQCLQKCVRNVALGAVAVCGFGLGQANAAVVTFEIAGTYTPSTIAAPPCAVCTFSGTIEGDTTTGNFIINGTGEPNVTTTNIGTFDNILVQGGTTTGTDWGVSLQTDPTTLPFNPTNILQMIFSNNAAGLFLAGSGTIFPSDATSGCAVNSRVSCVISGTITLETTSATPLPAALPLFATGLGGLGLLGWRRKRKAQAVA
jgi:hypothetical protein